MKSWIIEPHDTIIFRDGRPFGPNPGARAESLFFPFPSTTTGGLRTRAGLDAAGHFDTSRVAEVRQIRVRGPLLVELDGQGEIIEWLPPAPSDALLLDLEPTERKRASRKRLLPLEAPDTMTDLPAGLYPVGLSERDPRKPHKQPLRFWHWEKFEEWLREPQEGKIEIPELGHSGPSIEGRMHVSIEAGQGTAREGALFQTRGLEFTLPGPELSPLGEAQRLALAVVTDDGVMIRPGQGALGGERRLVRWSQSTKCLPDCPKTLRDAILRDEACRLVLLTPACFALGFHPTWLLHAGTSLAATVNGALVGRPQVVSGWDFTQKRGSKEGAPKPTRRLAPTGSVFFLSFKGAGRTAIEQWMKAVWMQNVSDDPQDRLDGFGLAVLGTWDGKPQPMNVEVQL